MEKAEVTFRHPSGRSMRVTNTPLCTVYIFGGTGYRYEDGWGHGVYQGPLVTQGLTYDISSPAARQPITGLQETLCRFELGTGEVGYGMHENMCLGCYRPFGFDDPLKMAP
jgi:hypothetical protein